MPKYLICIDDTDNLTSKGTGSIADELRELITKQLGGVCSFVTRHQLLIHEDIPYTSHNSSMCFACEIEDGQSDELKKMCYAHLQRESAEGSDPGIAVAHIGEADLALLEAFGTDAKRKLLSKQQAYATAKQANVWLDEAGGTGQGVVGALAGLGLRLGGNDGEIKGAKGGKYKAGVTYRVQEFLKGGLIQSVQSMDGRELAPHEEVTILWKAKPTLHKGKVVLLAKESADGWQGLEKQEMRQFSKDKAQYAACGYFSPDVIEEQIDDKESCYNCRYRRWTQDGILCQYE